MSLLTLPPLLDHCHRFHHRFQCIVLVLKRAECPSLYFRYVLTQQQLQLVGLLIVRGLAYILIKEWEVELSIAKTHQMAKLEVSQILAP